MKNFKLFTTLALLAITTSAFAQRMGQTNEIGVFYYPAQEQMCQLDVVDIIQQIPEHHFLDPKPPRFLLVDSEKKFALGIGGMVRATTAIDFDGIINTSTNEGFQTAFIPTYQNDAPRAAANMSAGQSEIFLKMVGMTRKIGAVEVYVSMNFMGDNYTPQLRNAYIEFLGLSAGKRWSLFTDLNAIPTTIDYAGPQSYAGYHVPQIRYTRMFAGERYKFGVSAEMPTVNATYASPIYVNGQQYLSYAAEEAQKQGVPNFVGYMQRNWDGGHVRVSGLYRSMNYFDEEMNSTERQNGWAVQLSGNSNLCHNLEIFYQGIYGKGISSYLNDLSNLPVDMVPNGNSLGAMEVLPMWGAYGGLKYDFNDEWYCSATYGYSQLREDGGFQLDGMYKNTQYIVANLFWNITGNCTAGVEYLRGTKRDFGGAFGTANRMNLMLQYCF